MDMDLVVESVPQFKRGIVWCTVCGIDRRVNSSNALSNGWPKCCGYTMTIDSPEERKKLRELRLKALR